MVAPARGYGSWAEHEELIDAIEAADPDRAQDLARQHTERTRAAYHGPRGLRSVQGVRRSGARGDMSSPSPYGSNARFN
jgi:hypothetical protein